MSCGGGGPIPPTSAVCPPAPGCRASTCRAAGTASPPPGPGRGPAGVCCCAARRRRPRLMRLAGRGARARAAPRTARPVRWPVAGLWAQVCHSWRAMAVRHGRCVGPSKVHPAHHTHIDRALLDVAFRRNAAKARAPSPSTRKSHASCRVKSSSFVSFELQFPVPLLPRAEWYAMARHTRGCNPAPEPLNCPPTPPPWTPPHPHVDFMLLTPCHLQGPYPHKCGESIDLTRADEAVSVYVLLTPEDLKQPLQK